MIDDRIIALDNRELIDLLNWVDRYYPKQFNQEVPLLDKVKKAADVWMGLSW